jgi:hypothetical protein
MFNGVERLEENELVGGTELNRFSATLAIKPTPGLNRAGVNGWVNGGLTSSSIKTSIISETILSLHMIWTS